MIMIQLTKDHLTNSKLFLLLSLTPCIAFITEYCKVVHLFLGLGVSETLITSKNRESLASIY